MAPNVNKRERIKTKLIRGWDDLFGKLREHLNALAAMRLSPYFKLFEEDALAWETRLTKMAALFDVWIDVQRRWVSPLLCAPL